MVNLIDNEHLSNDRGVFLQNNNDENGGNRKYWQCFQNDDNDYKNDYNDLKLMTMI